MKASGLARGASGRRSATGLQKFRESARNAEPHTKDLRARGAEPPRIRCTTPASRASEGVSRPGFRPP
eukprot:12106858-Alexandrium_andersonii.AAC.1